MTEPPQGQGPCSPQAKTGVVKTPRPESHDRLDSDPVAIVPSQASALPDTPQVSRQALAPTGDIGVPPTTPIEDDALVLPSGALLALRRSGGLLFESRAIVVYADGRLTTSTVGGGHAPRTGARALPAAQLARLRRTLAAIDFARLSDVPVGHPRPDAHAYEIAVRAGPAILSLEVFEGVVPPPLAPLLTLLNGVFVDGD